jgi:hypothetical protein
MAEAEEGRRCKFLAAAGWVKVEAVSPPRRTRGERRPQHASFKSTRRTGVNPKLRVCAVK